jgi:acetyl-CoA carboxylase biotin carboxylase subunit
LSENHKFAKLCEECGVQFIGPRSEVIEKMGDKESSRRTMKAAGVPVVEGCDLIESADMARSEAERIGCPVLIKARAGGGGRGIRLVGSPEEQRRRFWRRPTKRPARSETAVLYGALF